MHETVRAQVNAFPAAAFARGALNDQHLPGLLLASDSLNVNTTTRVSAAFSAETSADVLPPGPSWQLLSGFLLDNGGAGYAIAEPAIVIYAVTMRVENFYDPATGAATQPTQRQQCWFTPTLTVNGAEQVDLNDLGMVYGQFASGFVTGEEVMTVWGLYNRSLIAGAWTINSLQARAAKGQGSGAVGQNFDVVGGHMSLFVIPRQV